MSNASIGGVSFGAITTTPLEVPQLPNSASLLGLPPVPNVESFIASQSVPDAPVDTVGLPISDIQAQGQWGIFDSDTGEVIIQADTVLSIDYKNTWLISDYPQENGAFQSYNKVKIPYDVRVKFAIGGTQSDRENFLTRAEAAAESINTYTVTTPEAHYDNANIQHIDYRRETKDGASMIIMEVWLSEIRQASMQVTGTTSDIAVPLPADQVQDPSTADPDGLGTVQAPIPTIAAANALAGIPTAKQSAAIGNLLGATPPPNSLQAAVANIHNAAPGADTIAALKGL